MINLRAVEKKKTLVCKDCGSPFTVGEFSLLKKCENCFDRDQAWREQGIQEDIERTESSEDDSDE